MLITTPIPYANAKPHLGHLLEGIFNDTVARYFRSKISSKKTDLDEEILLSMGLDQHGLKMYEKALELGLEPEVFVEEIGKTFINLWKDFDIKYDVFIQTHGRTHQLVAKAIWRILQKKGLLYKKSYTGNYCVGCEEFKTESQLVDHKCPLHPNMETRKISEENYFFRLSNFESEIKDFLKNADIKPAFAKTEWLNFAQEGLQDMSCSREKIKLPWGVSVPGDEDQVMYVWIEALINYLTACVLKNQKNGENETEIDLEGLTDEQILAEIKKKFPIEVMYCGKDIAKFHVIVWPAILLALGLELPKKTIIHGFINDALGRKFSKSLGNGVMPEELVEKFGIDGTRFLLLHEVNVDGDTSFNMNGMIEAYNSHLADNIGNLAMRVSTLIEKNMDGKVSDDFKNQLKNQELEDSVLKQKSNFVEEKITKFKEKMDALDVRGGLDCLLEICRSGNELLEQTQPWKMFKNNQIQEAEAVLSFLAWMLIEVGDKLVLFVPKTGVKISQTFKSEKIEKSPVWFQKYYEI